MPQPCIINLSSNLNSGLKVAAWIANNVHQEMPYYQQNIDLLTDKIDAPKIAEIPYLTETDETDISQFVDFNFGGNYQQG